MDNKEILKKTRDIRQALKFLGLSVDGDNVLQKYIDFGISKEDLLLENKEISANLYKKIISEFLNIKQKILFLKNKELSMNKKLKNEKQSLENRINNLNNYKIKNLDYLLDRLENYKPLNNILEKKILLRRNLIEENNNYLLSNDNYYFNKNLINRTENRIEILLNKDRLNEGKYCDYIYFETDSNIKYTLYIIKENLERAVIKSDATTANKNLIKIKEKNVLHIEIYSDYNIFNNFYNLKILCKENSEENKINSSILLSEIEFPKYETIEKILKTKEELNEYNSGKYFIEETKKIENLDKKIKKPLSLNKKYFIKESGKLLINKEDFGYIIKDNFFYIEKNKDVKTFLLEKNSSLLTADKETIFEKIKDKRVEEIKNIDINKTYYFVEIINSLEKVIKSTYIIGGMNNGN